MIDLDIARFNRVIDEEIERLQKARKALNTLTGEVTKPRRHMSAAARERISRAAKAMWRKRRKKA